MKQSGICNITLIPMRKEPAERSEMVSQVLFGETFDIIKHEGSWSHISTHFDNYTGWVSNSMIHYLEDGELEKLNSARKIYLKDPICKISDNQSFLSGILHSAPNIPVSYLAGGSTLIEDKGNIHLERHVLKFDGKAEFYRSNDDRNIIGTAYKYLNSPYLWGGRTAFGIDCSGFTQTVFKSNGISLPRDAYQQAELGQKIDFEDRKPCDLAFFVNDSGRIMHVGIVLDNSEIIHSSGKVHIDRLDEAGIFNYKSKEYTHKLKEIRRIG